MWSGLVCEKGQLMGQEGQLGRQKRSLGLWGGLGTMVREGDKVVEGPWRFEL
jgi:hypothetical protein